MNKCHWCEKEIIRLHKDHHIPKYAGGSNESDNLLDTCAKCNLSKNRNFWKKNNDGTIEIYKTPMKFLSEEEDENSKRIAITTVYTLKNRNRRINVDIYKKFGKKIQ